MTGGDAGVAVHPSLLPFFLGVASTARPPTRERLLKAVQEYPGLHLRELARHLDVSPTHAKHHLDVLEEESRVIRSRHGGFVRYWPSPDERKAARTHLSEDERDIVRFLRRSTPRRILAQLTLDEGLTLSEVADECGIAPSTAHYHLSQLHEAGLVGREWESGDLRWEPPDVDELYRALLEYEPAPGSE